jgi:eukaryotic-like serine/threonine-protein kinase
VSLDDSDSDPRVGQVLGGRYKLLGAIAEGGMGVVYRGERVGLGRAVAVKFLHAWFASEEKARKRFEIEARAMARLQHPACASVIDFGLIDGSPYVVMDFFEGETLRDLLDRGPLDPGRAVAIIRQLLAGLSHAHGQGIIHRDIKPANVLVGEATGLGDQIRILDFGLAKLREGAPRLTAGVAIGTPAYMAPEQTLSETVDERTDVYATGVLLFEMLTGSKPFTADSPGEVLLMHRESARPRASWTAPDRGISAELDEVVATAMAVEPDERHDSAEAMAKALAATPEARGRASTHSGSRDISVTGATLPIESPVAAAPNAPALAAPSGPVPAGPAPSAAPGPVAAPPHPVAPARPWHRDRRIVGAIGGVAALVLIAVIAAVASSGGGDEGDPAETRAPVTAEAFPELAEARALVEQGQVDTAISKLEGLKRQRPEAAEIYYWLGRAYLHKLWSSDGMAAYRTALRIDPGYRSDEALIRSVLRAFLLAPEYRDSMAAFLRDDIGAPAAPYLEEAAREHSDPRRRERAQRLLDQIN